MHNKKCRFALCLFQLFYTNFQCSPNMKQRNCSMKVPNGNGTQKHTYEREYVLGFVFTHFCNKRRHGHSKKLKEHPNKKNVGFIWHS